MYKRFAFILLAFSISFSTFCQTSVDSIHIVKNAWSYTYFTDGYELTPENMKFVMPNNPKSLRYFKKAQTSSIISFGMGYLGRSLIGWPIGTALGGGKLNWIIAIIGCGVVAATIPIVNSSNRNLKKAIDSYNRGVSFADKPNIDVNLGLSRNGLGVLFRF
jgi:uncharacterized membrane protein YkgB